MEEVIEIKAVKYLGEGLELHCVRTRSGRTYDSPGEKHPTPVHANFQKALGRLAIHYALIMGLVKLEDVADIKKIKPEMLSDIRINGYSISSKGDTISIKGMIKAYNGQFSALTAPPQLLNPTEGGYMHIEELKKDLKKIKERVDSYLSGDEVGLSKQSSLDLPDAQEEAEQK